MILHLARALAVRHQAAASAGTQAAPSANPQATPQVTDKPRLSPVRVQPGYQPVTPAPAATVPQSRLASAPRPVSIRRDPADGRRTVIAGRFADVCAALDRMALELETA